MIETFDATIGGEPVKVRKHPTGYQAEAVCTELMKLQGIEADKVDARDILSRAEPYNALLRVIAEDAGKTFDELMKLASVSEIEAIVTGFAVEDIARFFALKWQTLTRATPGVTPTTASDKTP